MGAFLFYFLFSLNTDFSDLLDLDIRQYGLFPSSGNNHSTV